MTKGFALALCFSGIAVGLTGCGQVSAAEHFTLVYIERPKNYYQKPLHVTITNANTVIALYRDIRALKPFSPEDLHCPADFGIDYRIEFISEHGLALIANADPTGCSEVQMSTGKPLWAIGNKGQAFWRELAKAMGMPRVNDLWSQAP